MCIIFKLFIITLCFINRVKAQGGGVTGSGDYYVCVPPGYCIYGGNITTPGIDPRIVTPGQLCPDGQFPCYTQGPSSNCGLRLVSPAPSTADGFAPVGSHPWQAFIRNSTHPIYAGSGVLIDNYHVLTAAHKVAPSAANPASVTVIMGVTDPSNLANTQTRTASRIVVHPSYNSTYLKNDIAIIRVAVPFALNQTNINTLCLPAASATSPYISQQCLVAGWGETSFTLNDQPTNPMKQVNLNTTTVAACRTGLLTVLPTVDAYLTQDGSEICAGGESMKDACTYDGGAPLTCPNTGRGNIAGLVIWGKGCGQPNVYGVYVSVPFYRTWIDTTISTLNTTPAS